MNAHGGMAEEGFDTRGVHPLEVRTWLLQIPNMGASRWRRCSSKDSISVAPGQCFLVMVLNILRWNRERMFSAPHKLNRPLTS